MVKIEISIWWPYAILNFKRIINIWSCDIAIELQICFYVPTFVKIGRLSFCSYIWWFNDFQDGGRLSCPVEFSNFVVYVSFIYLNYISPCYSASPCKISLKCDNRLVSYGQKLFSIWRPSAVWNLRKNFVLGTLTGVGFWLCYCVPNFIKIWYEMASPYQLSFLLAVCFMLK